MAIRSLTPKQRRFVDEYLIDLNASAAALRAGYRHADSGRQLITKPHIQEAIAAAQAERAGRTELSQDWVIRRLQREARLGGEGSSHAARVAALKLLGQHLGLFPHKHVHAGDPDQPIRYEHVVAARIERFAALYDHLVAGQAALSGTARGNGVREPLGARGAS